MFSHPRKPEHSETMSRSSPKSKRNVKRKSFSLVNKNCISFLLLSPLIIDYKFSSPFRCQLASGKSLLWIELEMKIALDGPLKALSIAIDSTILMVSESAYACESLKCRRNALLMMIVESFLCEWEIIVRLWTVDWKPIKAYVESFSLMQFKALSCWLKQPINVPVALVKAKSAWVQSFNRWCFWRIGIGIGLGLWIVLIKIWRF